MKHTEDPSWEAYPNTLIEFHGVRKITVDLRGPIKADLRQALKGIGFEAAFAILTACNPFGHHADEKENCRRTNELANDLSDLLVTMIPADGVSQDGNHRERGYAVAIPRPQAKTLAMKYGQSAFFWFDGEQFWIMPALIQAEPISLPCKV